MTDNNSSIVRCADCRTKNRVRSVPQGKLPICGKCGKPLAWVVEADDGNFDDHVRAGIPVLVDFWAEWCGPCRRMAPMLQEIAEEYRGKLKLVKLNTQHNPNAAKRFRIRSIPTLVLFKKGEPAEVVVGAMPKTALKARIARHL
jgi:thioredoxin 2